jgi:polyisoprenoid-binding protein YceI
MRTAMAAGVAAAILFGDAVPQANILPAGGAAIDLYVDKTGVLSGKRHHFTFERYEGRLDAAARRVTVAVYADSIVCRDTWVSEKDRVKILKVAKEEMLASAKYPLLRFESSRVSGGEELVVEGLLTIRDKTRPVTVSVRQKGGTFSGEARLKLTDFGLKPPSAALGLVGTKDEMTVRFTVVAR